MHTAPASPAALPGSIDVRLGDMAVGLMIFGLMALGIGLRAPWAPDEPRFALMAMDMVQNHHWLLPHRGGEIYADKPPLFMWMQALLFLAIGNMKLAFLLPSLLSSLLTLVLVHDLSRRLFGRDAARFAMLLLALTLQFMMQAKAAQIDATLCACTTLALYGLIRHHCLGPSTRWNAIAWLAMGLGIIVKGVGFLPVLALPGLAIAGWLANGVARPTRDFSWPTALAPLLILLPAAAWLLPVLYRAYGQGDAATAAYLDELLFRQTVTRYGEGLGHFRPPWYFITNVIPVFWLPLSLLLPWVVPDWIRQCRAGSRAHWGLLAYLLLGITFFSLSPGKRGVYMLPLLPAAVVLVSGSLDRLTGRSGPLRLLRMMTLFVGLVCLAVSLALLLPWERVTLLVARQGVPSGVLAALSAAIGGTFLLAGMTFRDARSWTVAFLLAWVILSTAAYRAFDVDKSERGLMQDIAARIGPDRELAIIKFREQQLLQADRDIVHWGYHDDTRSQLVDAADWLRSSADRALLVPMDVLEKCGRGEIGEWVGFAHRRDWRLLLSGDAGDLPGCVSDAPAAKRYLARQVGFPQGDGAKR